MTFRLIIFLLAAPLSFLISATAQNAYFPPAENHLWAIQSPESLGWNMDKLDELIEWLGNNETRAFIILKNGKIVVEHYYRQFGRETEWYWASAGKTVTATLIGALEKQGLLDIENPTSDYLGAGWTSLSKEQEERIKLRNQLAMTTGLEYDIDDLNCTLPECLSYRKTAGEQWYYHNAPYTLLTHVVESVTETSLNEAVIEIFGSVPGLQLRFMEGLSSPYNRVVVSRALDMARFGLLMSRETAWEDAAPLLHSGFYADMLQSSQQLNPSYGYLWWLNGQESFIPPQLNVSIPRSLTPEAPADMVSALGMNAQVLSIVPSQNLIVVRMGQNPGSLFEFLSRKWELLSEVMEKSTSSEKESEQQFGLEHNYPNPFNPGTFITYHLPSSGSVRLQVFELSGQLVSTLVDDFKPAGTYRIRYDGSGLSSGMYIYRLETLSGTLSRKMLLLR